MALTPDERFHKAASDGYLDLLREATRKDLNQSDEDGMTPTLWAAACGNLEALRLIIGRGGNPDKCDYQGRTALHHAVMNGHYNCLTYLVSWGCNIWAMDNDQHTALDLSLLHNKDEISRYLDGVQALQQTKNRKTVEKLKERAIVDTERNIKRYEKLQEQAQRKAEKEERRLQKERDLIENKDAISSSGKSTIKEKLKTLTLRYKGRPKLYSEYTHGPDNNLIQPYSGKKASEFKVGEIDESGKRTIRSLSGLKRGTEVMYVPNRPSVHNLVDIDLNGDSGIDSSNFDDEDMISGSIFNRPGVGKIAFLPRNSVAVPTLRSIPQDPAEAFFDEELDPAIHYFHNREDSVADSIGTANTLVQRMGNLPWNEDEVEELDDDEELSDYSPLELFLATCSLTDYLAIFTQEKIDLDALLLLQDEDMKDLGLEMGPRRKLKDAIQRRKDIIQNPGAMLDSYL